MSKKSDVRRGYTRRQEAEAATPVAEETGVVEAEAAGGLQERLAGWVTGLGRMFVSREGAAITLFVVALGFLAMTLAGSKVAAVLMIVSLATAACLAAPLVGINLGGWISRVTGHWRPDLVWEFDTQPRLSRIARWRPKWQRPSWLRMPKIGRPQIQRPQVRLSWPSRLPRPSRAWLAWGPMQQRVTAVAILVVVLITLIVLWPSPAPTTVPAAVVEEPAAEQAVAAVAPVAQEPAAEPMVVPVEEVEVVEPESTAETITEPAVEPAVGPEPEAEPEAGAVIEAEQEAEVVVEAETAVETAAQTETETETEAHIVTVESGDTVWGLLTEGLGHAPTWEQIRSVVDANDLVDKGVNEDGLWIVLIQIGQTIDLTPGLAVG